MATSSSRGAVILDLDGTLIDVSSRDYAVYHDVLAAHGHQPLPFATYWPLRRERTPLQDLLARTVPEADRYVPVFVEARSARYEAEDYLQRDRVFDGAAAALGALGRRYDRVLVTSRLDEVAARTQLARLGLDRHVDAVRVGGGDKTAVFLDVPEAIAAVGDTEVDVSLAQRRGIPVVAVSTGMRSAAFLAALRPTHVADTLGAALDLL